MTHVCELFIKSSDRSDDDDDDNVEHSPYTDWLNSIGDDCLDDLDDADPFFWSETPFMEQKLPIIQSCAPSVTIETPLTYFRRYFNDEHFENTALYTNMYHLQTTEKYLKTYALEIKQLYGIFIMMSTLNYPKPDMYWRYGFKIDKIASRMSRIRFRALCLALHYRDVSVSSEADSLFWKIQPIINCVKQRCNNIVRNIEQYSVVKQVISIDGGCPLRQLIDNEPTRPDITNFVIETSKGLIMDFELYQGQFTILDDISMGLGAAIMLQLVKTIPAGSFIFFNKFFTTIPLLKKLDDLNLKAIGMIRNKHVKCVSFKSNSQLNCGEAQEICYDNGNHRISVVKWKDTKCATLASTVAGINPAQKVVCWSNRDRQFIEIDCPMAFFEYKKYMGSKDGRNQVIESHRTPLKTKKWTVKLVQYLIDMVVENSWNEYRRDCESFSNTFGKIAKPMSLFDFRCKLGESLLSSKVPVEDDIISSESSDDENETPRKITKMPPLPDEALRYDRAGHLPEFTKTSQCCQYDNCNKLTKLKCIRCGVFLCLCRKRNCFKDFHVRQA